MRQQCYPLCRKATYLLIDRTCTNLSLSYLSFLLFNVSGGAKATLRNVIKMSCKSRRLGAKNKTISVCSKEQFRLLCGFCVAHNDSHFSRLLFVLWESKKMWHLSASLPTSWQRNWKVCKLFFRTMCQNLLYEFHWFPKDIHSFQLVLHKWELPPYFRYC